MAEENFDKLRQLLSQKATDMPSDSYFDGVLGELHRRQRAALIPAPNKWRQAWDSFLEAITPDFTPAYRYATALVAVGAIGVGGWSASTAFHYAPSASPLVASVSIQAPAPAVPLPIAVPTSYVSSAIPVNDNFDVQPVAEAPAQDQGQAQPHYMLTSASPMDSSIAF
jgi:hypothetical protein